jgi:hypothetical protein
MANRTRYGELIPKWGLVPRFETTVRRAPTVNHMCTGDMTQATYGEVPEVRCVAPRG